MSKSKKAFTLNELMVVVIIVGILAAMGLVRYQKTVLLARANEARATLRLIQAGQKIYRSKNPNYLADCDIADINTQLGLDLEESYWDYCAYNNVGSYIARAGYPSIGAETYGYQILETGDATCYTGAGTCPE